MNTKILKAIGISLIGVGVGMMAYGNYQLKKIYKQEFEKGMDKILKDKDFVNAMAALADKGSVIQMVECEIDPNYAEHLKAKESTVFYKEVV